MKFTIKTSDLKAALEICSVAMMGRATLPILSNVKIEALEGRIILSTTNLEIYVKQKAEAKVSKEGAVTVAFALFSGYIREIDAAELTITQGKNHVIDCKSGEKSFTMETIPAEDFPQQLKQEGKPKRCDAADITKPLSMLRYAICQDESRYILQGIRVAPVEGRSEYIATEGHVICTYDGENIAGEEAIIPDSFVTAFLKIKPGAAVAVLISNGAISIQSEETFLQGKLIEGNFPNWKQAVPARLADALSCGRKPLIRALKFCAQALAGSQVPGLYLAGKGKEVEVSLPGKAVNTLLGTELETQPQVTIKIDAHFLIETLSVMEGDDVRIQHKDKSNVIMIEEGKFSATIMLLKQ